MKSENTEVETPRMLQVLTKKDAADYLQISVRTLNDRLIKTKKIRTFKVGDRNIRIFLSEIYKYVNGQLDDGKDK